MQDNRTIEDVAYSKYQLDWMKDHNIEINDLIDGLDSVYNEYIKQGVHFKSLHTVYDYWEANRGFDNNELWKGKNEFLENEYQNKEYIENLLSGNEFEEYIDEKEEERNEP